MFCPACKKEVVIYSISSFSRADEAMKRIQETAEADGKIVLFNPPPFGPYYCPNCFKVLKEGK